MKTRLTSQDRTLMTVLNNAKRTRDAAWIAWLRAADAHNFLARKMIRERSAAALVALDRLKDPERTMRIEEITRALEVEAEAEHVRFLDQIRRTK